MKTYVITIVLVLISAFLFAQTKNLSLDEIAAHVSNGLIKNYHPDSAILSKTCRRGFLFIKFKVNRAGKISDLAFSKDSTVFITAALKAAVYSLQSDIILINTLSASGKIIVQPFLYLYQSGCNFPKGSLSATAEEQANFNRSYLTILLAMDGIDGAASDILTFNDKRIKAIDGIILSPIMVSSGSME